MIQLRKTYFKKAAPFARFLGVSRGRWNNYERGFPLNQEMVFLLCEKCDGLTPDWIYFGLTGNLSMAMARRLGVLDGSFSSAGKETKMPGRRKRRL